MKLDDWRRLHDEFAAMIRRRAPIGEIVEKMRTDVTDVKDRRSLVKALAESYADKHVGTFARSVIAALQETVG